MQLGTGELGLLGLGLAMAGALAACSGSETTNATPPHDAGSDASDASSEAPPDAPAESSLDAGPDGPVSSAGSCGDVTWAASYGGGPKGDLFGLEQATAAAVDPAGNAWVVGHYYGAIDFGVGPLAAAGENRSAFFVELDPTGKPLASGGFGDPSGGLLYVPAATAKAVALVPGAGPVIVGSFAGSIEFGAGVLSSNDTLSALDAGAGCLSCAPDLFVLSLDPKGKTLWAKRWGGPDSDAAFAVAVDAASNLFVAGDFEGTLDFGLGAPLVSAGGKDGFVVELDASGNPVWAVSFGGPKDDVAESVVLDAGGDVRVGGVFSASASFGGSMLSAAGDFDGFVLTLSATGSQKAVHALGASQRAGVASLVARPGGGYVAAGWARGNVTLAGKSLSTWYDDAFVVSVDASGNESWAKLFGTPDNDQATASVLLANGHVVVSASVGVGLLDLGGGPLTGNLSDGAALLELDENGAHVCSRRWIAESTNEPIGDSGMTLGGSLDVFGLAARASGELVVAGALTGQSTLGQSVVTSSGGTDVLIARVAPP